MAVTRVMKARHESLCLLCWQPIRIGQQIGKAPIGWCHVACIIDRARHLTTSTPPNRKN
jgi:hypothetical protein